MIKMNIGEARHDAERSGDMHAKRRSVIERRLLLARGIGKFVAAKRGEQKAQIAERCERTFETLVGIALGDQRTHQRKAFVGQGFLDPLAYAVDVGAIFLREVKLFQFGVHRPERGANPPVEIIACKGHR